MMILRSQRAGTGLAGSLVLAVAVTGLAGCADAPPVSDVEGDGVAAQASSPAADGTPSEHEGHALCTSTWQAIQKSIFEAKSCAASACHSTTARAGQLDLAASDAYVSLINRPARASLTRPMNLVTPGEQALSFLYQKLAAATEKTELPTGGGSPMPVGQSPLSADQLKAVKLWIRAGAPQTGVVEGTQELLDCHQPKEADPNKAPRPPVPPASEGFQHVAGSWTVKPNAENEVCFATYYDLSASAPEWAKVPCTIGGREQTCVAYNRRELSQDSQSHHSIVSIYAGNFDASDPAWGKWTCSEGDHAGAACDPTKLGVSAAQGGAECGGDGVCQAPPRKMFGCTGFGPNDKEAASVGAGGSQSPVSADRFPEGVYSRVPLKGVVLWNSHGFNLTNKPANIAQYNTFWYAKPEQRTYVMNGIFTAGGSRTNSNVFLNIPPFEQREYCALYTLPQHARLADLSAHAHKRAVLWRTWLPPNEPTCPAGGCTPNERPSEYRSAQYNDPVVKRFDPPIAFDQEDPATRTLKFCAVYDNGKNDPSLLKRKSRLPDGAACRGQLYCAGGDKQGQACGDDAACGGGGVCEACGVTFGPTTEDEMFFLMGGYYVQKPK